MVIYFTPPLSFSGQDAPSLPSGPASLGGWRWELQRALTWQPQAGLWEAPGQDLGTRQRRQVFPVLPEKKRVEVGLGIGEEIRGAPELGGSPGRRRGAAPRRVLLPPGSDFSPRCRLCGFQPVRLQERVDGSLRTKEAVQGAGEGSSCDPWGTPPDASPPSWRREVAHLPLCAWLS